MKIVDTGKEFCGYKIKEKCDSFGGMCYLTGIETFSDALTLIKLLNEQKIKKNNGLHHYLSDIEFNNFNDDMYSILYF